MKKTRVCAAILVGILLGGSVAFADSLKVLKVGATPVPHAAILKSIIPALRAKGIDLRVIEFTD